MSIRSRLLLSVILGLLLLATALSSSLAAPPAQDEAQLPVGYQIIWSNPDGSGARMSSAHFLVQSTAGQPIVGVMSGPTYRMEVGFWSDYWWNAAFLPLIRR
jgi:hypothetical protein